MTKIMAKKLTPGMKMYRNGDAWEVYITIPSGDKQIVESIDSNGKFHTSYLKADSMVKLA